MEQKELGMIGASSSEAEISSPGEEMRRTNQA
jgi:hypothetical protein